MNVHTDVSFNTCKLEPTTGKVTQEVTREFRSRSGKVTDSFQRQTIASTHKDRNERHEEDRHACQTRDTTCHTRRPITTMRNGKSNSKHERQETGNGDRTHEHSSNMKRQSSNRKTRSTRTRTRTRKHSHPPTQAFTHTHTHIHKHSHTHTLTHIHTHTHTHTRTHTHTPNFSSEQEHLVVRVLHDVDVRGRGVTLLLAAARRCFLLDLFLTRLPGCRVA
jgi:hypothetical protein